MTSNNIDSNSNAEIGGIICSIENKLSNGYSSLNGKSNLIDKTADKPIICTTNLPISTVAPSMLNNFKSWSLDAYKYARQFLSEQLAHGTRTTDIGIDNNVDMIICTQAQLSNLIKSIHQFLVSFQNILITHEHLSEAFKELIPKSDGLNSQLLINAEVQRAIVKNGNSLIPSLKSFKYNMSTLRNVAIDDALNTVKLYESARLKFDAHRVYMDELRGLPKNQSNLLKIQLAEATFVQHKVKFERLHHDLNIKIQFLEDNKVVVCEKNLILLNQAFLTYIQSTNDHIQEIINSQITALSTNDYINHQA